jgi:hypothetical protein
MILRASAVKKLSRVYVDGVDLIAAIGGDIDLQMIVDSAGVDNYLRDGPRHRRISAYSIYLSLVFHVNAVSPGPVHTNISDGTFDKHPEFIKPLAEQTALGRIGSPQDVANVIVNLVSDDFGWVTAQDIDVSGGFLL